MARSSVKRTRPSWWTPEGVLARLHDGEYIGLICQECADEMSECGAPMSPLSLRAEVNKWAESASWGEQIKAALGLWKKTTTGHMTLSKDWHDEFFVAMDATGGNAEQAAPMAGVSYGIVLALTDKRNKCFDAQFAERFRIAELERVGRIRGKYMEIAENGEGKVAIRAQEKLIEAALPSLHGQRQEIRVSGEVEHNHIHGLQPGLAREVVAASQAMMKNLFAGRRDALPAPDPTRIIDVTPIQEKNRA
jgi:hypothetical protein